MFRAIVTGSNGFIGYNLCQFLVGKGCTVLGVDDLSGSAADHTVEGVSYQYTDVADNIRIRQIIEAFKPDTIFHLAAKARVSRSVKEPYMTAQTNTMGIVSLLEGIVKAGRADKTRIIFSSSSSIYGGADTLPTPETYPANPKSPYALQKYQCEQWMKLFATLYGVDTVNLRYFNVFGPHALFGGAYSAVLSAWMYKLFVDNSYKPFLEGDGLQTRDFSFIGNTVQANWLAATHDGRFDGESFNIAQGQTHTLLQCKEMLEDIAGKPLELEMRPTRVGDVKHSFADISKAKRRLGYDPSTDFVQQLSVMADWYKTSYPTK